MWTENTVIGENIISRLKFFNYRYELRGTRLKVFLPMLCYLKIDFKNGKMKMSSGLDFGFNFLSLEYNFIIYSFILYILTWYKWATLPRAGFLILGLFVIYFVVCFIKIESLKIIIHNWIERDRRKVEIDLKS